MIPFHQMPPPSLTYCRSLRSRRRVGQYADRRVFASFSAIAARMYSVMFSGMMESLLSLLARKSSTSFRVPSGMRTGVIGVPFDIFCPPRSEAGVCHTDTLPRPPFPVQMSFRPLVWRERPLEVVPRETAGVVEADVARCGTPLLDPCRPNYRCPL